jgi:hypothetical protein
MIYIVICVNYWKVGEVKSMFWYLTSSADTGKEEQRHVF